MFIDMADNLRQIRSQSRFTTGEHNLDGPQADHFIDDLFHFIGAKRVLIPMIEIGGGTMGTGTIAGIGERDFTVTEDRSP